MSVFDRHPRMRWAVPAAAAGLIVAGVAVAPLAATADSGLPTRTAQDLLVDLTQPTTQAVSGTVATKVDLGLPDLPMGMVPSNGPLALALGDGTVRVWSDGPQRQRVAVLAPNAETTMVRDGREVWVWSSAEATADRYELPDGDAGMGLPSELPEGVTVPSTPQEAAALALSAIDPTTEVTTSGVARVAGRDAYELVLTPRAEGTLVQRVTLAIDAETKVPLRVQVFSTKQAAPAVQVGFTSVDFSTPDASLFDFTPPPGATVTDHDLAAAKGPAVSPEELAAGKDAGAAEPTVVGEGWTAVAVGTLPVGGLADLAEQGSTPEGDDGRGDPAATALALLQAMPTTSGTWGTGRVLAGTLFSVIVTDDGRFAVGAVPPEALGAALARR
ncbi:MAG TPA: sigma-E factor regulatory protein RseB domain-containing protein [Candidatus Nanopelagicales bacterium]